MDVAVRLPYACPGTWRNTAIEQPRPVVENYRYNNHTASVRIFLEQYDGSHLFPKQRRLVVEEYGKNRVVGAKRLLRNPNSSNEQEVPLKILALFVKKRNRSVSRLSEYVRFLRGKDCGQAWVLRN